MPQAPIEAIQRLISEASTAAASAGAPVVGTEHFLLVLLMEADVAERFRQFGVDHDAYAAVLASTFRGAAAGVANSSQQREVIGTFSPKMSTLVNDALAARPPLSQLATQVLEERGVATGILMQLHLRSPETVKRPDDIAAALREDA